MTNDEMVIKLIHDIVDEKLSIFKYTFDERCGVQYKMLASAHEVLDERISTLLTDMLVDVTADFRLQISNQNKLMSDYAKGLQNVYDEFQSLKCQLSSANLDKFKGEIGENKSDEDFKIGDKIWYFDQMYENQTIWIDSLSLQDDTIIRLFDHTVETNHYTRIEHKDIFKSQQDAIDAMYKRLEELK